MTRSIGIAILLGFFAVALGAGIGLARAEKRLDASLWEAARVWRPAEPIETPPVTLTDLTGRTVSLRDFRGEVVMLYFWATWRPNCARELPSIDALQDELKGHGFTVLLLDIAEGLETVAATVKERGYRLPVLLDTDGRTTNAYRVIATPTVFLVGRDGALLGRAIGPRSWAKGPARTLLDVLLKAPDLDMTPGAGRPSGS